ncbi:MAG TPA: hypothetical protein VEU30_00265 [Thermoanaerobaculia bacterium]|nr:hypothetical protein [Thermoanaerobaculia bacterium]
MLAAVVRAKHQTAGLPWAGVKKGIRAGVPCAVLFFFGGFAHLFARAWIHGGPSVESRASLIVYGTIGSVILSVLAAMVTTAVISRTPSTTDLL